MPETEEGSERLFYPKRISEMKERKGVMADGMNRGRKDKSLPRREKKVEKRKEEEGCHRAKRKGS